MTSITENLLLPPLTISPFALLCIYIIQLIGLIFGCSEIHFQLLPAYRGILYKVNRKVTHVPSE